MISWGEGDDICKLEDLLESCLIAHPLHQEGVSKKRLMVASGDPGPSAFDTSRTFRFRLEFMVFPTMRYFSDYRVCVVPDCTLRYASLIPRKNFPEGSHGVKRASTTRPSLSSSCARLYGPAVIITAGNRAARTRSMWVNRYRLANKFLHNQHGRHYHRHSNRRYEGS